MFYTFTEKTLYKLIDTYGKKAKLYAVIVSETINASLLAQRLADVTEPESITDDDRKGG